MLRTFWVRNSLGGTYVLRWWLSGFPFYRKVKNSEHLEDRLLFGTASAYFAEISASRHRRTWRGVEGGQEPVRDVGRLLLEDLVPGEGVGSQQAAHVADVRLENAHVTRLTIKKQVGQHLEAMDTHSRSQMGRNGLWRSVFRSVI